MKQLLQIEQNLPQEILIHIMSFMDLYHLIEHIRLVSRCFKNLSSKIIPSERVKKINNLKKFEDYYKEKTLSEELKFPSWLHGSNNKYYQHGLLYKIALQQLNQDDAVKIFKKLIKIFGKLAMTNMPHQECTYQAYPLISSLPEIKTNLIDVIIELKLLPKLSRNELEHFSDHSLLCLAYLLHHPDSLILLDLGFLRISDFLPPNANVVSNYIKKFFFIREGSREQYILLHPHVVNLYKTEKGRNKWLSSLHWQPCESLSARLGFFKEKLKVKPVKIENETIELNQTFDDVMNSIKKNI